MDIVRICIETNCRIRDKVKGNYVNINYNWIKTDHWGIYCVTRRGDKLVE